MPLSDYQRVRIEDVQQWYDQVYRPLDDRVPVVVRYMTLWAVFNALYNIADYPNVKLRSVAVDEGITKPNIGGRNDDKKLRFISRQLACDTGFINSLFQNHRVFISYWAGRRPAVAQPAGTQSIQFQHDNQSYTIQLSDLYGIASIDNRITQADGTVLFQYHHLELDLNNNDLPRDPQKFFRQLVFVLYQLRNNIVHGGSASFFMQKKEITVGSIELLDAMVRHLLAHRELLAHDGP